MSKRGDTACWVVAGVCLAAVAIFLADTPTGEWDAWWHLAIGRAAVEQGTRLSTDIFSYSFAGAPWGHKDLVADVLLYVGFEAVGHAVFGILKAFVVVAVALSVLFAMPRAGRHPALAVLLTGVAVCALQYRFSERPILFSLALFPLLVALLERLRSSLLRADPRPAAAALPSALLLAVWAQLHREVLVGVALAVLALAWMWLALACPKGKAVFVFGKGAKARSLAVATAVVVCGCALCAATPSGLHLVASSVGVAKNDMLRRLITDWVEIGPRELLIDFPVTTALVISASSAWAARFIRARRMREENPPVTALHGAVLFSFLALTLSDSVRWVPMLSSYAALVLAVIVGDAAAIPGRLGRLGSTRAKLVSTAVAGIAVLALVAARNDFGRGLGPMPDRFPEGAMRFAREHDLGGKAFNSFHLGGYAIWAGYPKIRVLVDGRNDLVYPAKFIVAASRASDDPEVFAALLKKHGGDFVLASNLAGHLGFTFLSRDPEWMEVYWSEAAVIYVRRSEHRELADLAFRFVDPRAVDVSIAEAVRRFGSDAEAMARLEREVLRMREASPEGLRANTAAALFYHLRGPAFVRQRDAALGVLRDRHSDVPAVRELFRRLDAE